MAPPVELAEMNKYLLESGDNSDMIVKCQDQVFHVHRSIIYSRCPDFGSTTEGRPKNPGKVEFPTGDPLVVKALITYLYTNEYSDQDPTLETVETEKDVSTSDGEDNIASAQAVALSKSLSFSMLFNVKLYLLGQTHGMTTSFFKLVTQKFRRCAQKTCDMETFVQAAKLPFATTKHGAIVPSRMKKAMLEVMILRSDAWFLDHDMFRIFLDQWGKTWPVEIPENPQDSEAFEHLPPDARKVKDLSRVMHEYLHWYGEDDDGLDHDDHDC